MGWRFLPSLDVGSNATVSHCLLCMERIELGAELPQIRLTATDVTRPSGYGVRKG
jgi:hypothetical protein